MMATDRQGSGSEATDRKMGLEEMLAPFGELRFAVLATADEGRPYASLVAFAFTPDCRTLIFSTARSTSKYRNITNQPAVSLLIDNRSQQPDDLLGAQAVTLIGTVEVITSAARGQKYRQVFESRHPHMAAFLDDPETALVAVTIRQAVHVTGLQDVSYWP
jgi:heme iron utilization protein